MVIGSANASARALGFDGRPATLVEAGTFHETGSDIWEAASDWFARKFEEARVVDQNAVEDARYMYRAPAMAIEQSIADMTVLEQIAHMPQWFDGEGIGFVITLCPTDLGTAQEAIREAISNVPEARDLDRLDWDNDRVFGGWGSLSNLRHRFVELYLGTQDGPRLITHEVVIQDNIGGNFFTKPPDSPIVAMNGADLNGEVNEEELRILKVVSEKSGGQGKIFTAASFADALQQAYAEREG